MLKEIIKRLKAKTPKFFKNLIKISLAVSAISGAILTSGLVIPDSVAGWISQIGIIAGLVSAGISKLTTIYGISEETEESPIIYAKEDETINPDGKDNPKTKP